MLAIPILPFSYSLDSGIPPSVGYRASVGYRGLSHGLWMTPGLVTVWRLQVVERPSSPSCFAVRVQHDRHPVPLVWGSPRVPFLVLHLIYLVPSRCCRGEGQVIGSCALGAMRTSRCQDHLSLGVPSARARAPMAWQWSRARYSGYSYTSHAFLLSTHIRRGEAPGKPHSYTPSSWTVTHVLATRLHRRHRKAAPHPRPRHHECEGRSHASGGRGKG